MNANSANSFGDNVAVPDRVYYVAQWTVTKISGDLELYINKHVSSARDWIVTLSAYDLLPVYFWDLSLYVFWHLDFCKCDSKAVSAMAVVATCGGEGWLKILKDCVERRIGHS